MFPLKDPLFQDFRFNYIPEWTIWSFKIQKNFCVEAHHNHQAPFPDPSPQISDIRTLDSGFISGKHFEMSSFGEKKAIKFSKDNCPEFLEYNQRQLSRIYPAGLRIDSSNYNPVQFWNVGCQLGNDSIDRLILLLKFYKMGTHSTRTSRLWLGHADWWLQASVVRKHNFSSII